MSMSPTIGKVAAAMSKVQKDIEGAKKDTVNPFFKSKYADLASVWEACRAGLAANDVAVLQPLDYRDGKQGVSTILMHSSGEYIEGFMPLPVSETADAQKVGSAVTYIRRYALSSTVGVSPEEDDGNSASEAPKKIVTASKQEKTLVERAEAFSKHLDSMRTKQSVDNAVTASNALMKELKEKLPQDFDKISVKINQIKEAFDLAEQTPLY